ncbi:MAG: hypothetical protein IJQ12_09285 [Lachnospiraceae bacterium]|nr:hypothetical protein [Lachnospiraceae bacterium]
MGMDGEEKTPEEQAIELYQLGEEKLEAAKHSSGSKSTYRDCAELAYYAMLYGIKAALAIDSALPETQDECFEVFSEFHVGTEAFPEEAWIRMDNLIKLRGVDLERPDFVPELRDVNTQIESAEYMLLLTNMFLNSRGVPV